MVSIYPVSTWKHNNAAMEVIEAVEIAEEELEPSTPTPGLSNTKRCCVASTVVGSHHLECQASKE